MNNATLNIRLHAYGETCVFNSFELDFVFIKPNVVLYFS